MWTPRRLLLLVIGVVAFTTVFVGYFALLGRIDGLPQLPAAFLERRSPDDADVVVNVKNPVIDIKLQRAFGPGCAEMSYNHRIELQKNGVILATNQITVEPDGRCKLKPFSIAVVKEKGPGNDPEVYTAHSDEAIILFDSPVKNLAEMGKRKIVGCDLVSDATLLSPDPRAHRVTCNHNRGTIDPGDDLLLETNGPVAYRDVPQPEPPPDLAPPHIATTAAVRLMDKRGQPQGTTITADGMKIFLANSSPTTVAQQPANKPPIKSTSVSGVRKVELCENVTMNLWIDPNGGFLSTGRPRVDAPAAADKPQERSNVQITTPGPFKYEVGQEVDRGRFEMKPGAGPDGRPGFVQVVRPLVKDGATLYDRLDCDVLEMQFGHKQPAVKDTRPNASPKADSESTLQWVHAWGQFLVLTSQAENLQALGNDLYHDAATRKTTLKGTPEVTAIKDAHEIHTPTLVLTAADAKGGQEAVAEGAGYFMGIVPGDSNGGEAPRSIVARWRDRMHYRKDQGLELITLTGAAVFEDQERKQSIHGDQIKLTLAPDMSAAGKAALPGSPRMKPRRLEVTGQVAAKSAELNIHDTDQLVLLFQDVAAVPGPKKEVANGVKPIPTPAEPPPAKVVAIPTAQEKKTEPKAKPPLDLSAKSIQGYLLARSNGPTDLDNVHCEGRVLVHQESANPSEKPVDMKGDTLQLTNLGEGHKLLVTGDAVRPAEVHLPDLSLIGPNIELNQVDNTARVTGPGSMRLMSTSDFQGNKLAKASELLISWKQEMDFNGQLARFQGNVQACQDNTRLLCHGMQVTLDKPVHFNQAQASSGPSSARAANVDKVVCETTGTDGAQPVSVEDSVRENGRLVRYQRIEARELAVFKTQGQLDARGQGEVRILQMGPKTPADATPSLGGAKAAPKPAGPAEEEMKLTYVRYGQKLLVDNDRRTATFWKNVEVLHLPADDPGLRLNLSNLIDKLPKGALYLKCDLLKVYTREQAGKKTSEMHAEQKASVQFDNFFGSADVIKYNEASQQVIFEGRAVLNQVVQKGVAPKTFRGQKFTYNRGTGQFDGNDVISISDGGRP